MTEPKLDLGATVALPKAELALLLQGLQEQGFETIGPRLEEQNLVYGLIEGLEDLPRGYSSEQQAGRYRLQFTGHDLYFGLTPGPQSWKQYFFPPRAKMIELHRSENGWQRQNDFSQSRPLALIGVRPCELAAIQLQDAVFLRDDWSDPLYRLRRQSAFILSVDCFHPGGTCFCASLGAGPKSGAGFDLNLSELEDVFLAEVGSEAGREQLSRLSYEPASAFLLQTARRNLEEAQQQMGRQIEHPERLAEMLLGNLNAAEWERVGKRCLSCASCTQVCPTCFCWDVRDQPDLSGQAATRERLWDSCFNPDYSYVVGGSTRPNTTSRYRQWLTHKFASWQGQFGSLGCVGCGRCITWCPAGIDLTVELENLRKEVA